MRILQIVNGFPPESIAGTETYCEVLSRHLLERGHECIVLAGSSRLAPEAILATVDQEGLSVTRYLRAEGRPLRWTEEYDPEAEELTRWFVDRVRPDLIHLHHWHRLTNNLVAICVSMGIPVVVTLHDVWASCPRLHRIRSDGTFCEEPPLKAPCLTCAERGPWQLDRELVGALALRREVINMELALVDAIIVPSEAHRKFSVTLLDLPEDRLIVLPHGRTPTITAWEERKGRLTFPNRPLQIGHWGFLMFHKGTHLVLEAVKKLRDPSAVHVHLIGNTIEEAYLLQLQDLARGLPVQFHGAYRPADLQALDLDLAVFASITSESYSFTLDEALCLGLPVLVPDRGALPERIGTAGLTFRAGDADDLARQLQQILDAPAVLDSLRRSARPELLLSMKAHVDMLDKIYEGAVRGSGPARAGSIPYVKLIAEARRQTTGREQALAELTDRLSRADQMVREKQGDLQRAQEALREREALLQQAQRANEHLRTENAALQADVEELRQLPLLNLQRKLLRLLGRR